LQFAMIGACPSIVMVSPAMHFPCAQFGVMPEQPLLHVPQLLLSLPTSMHAPLHQPSSGGQQ